MHTLVKNFQISVQGFSMPLKTGKTGNFKRGACGEGTAQTAQFPVIGIIFGASQHPKGVPFVREFWW